MYCKVFVMKHDESTDVRLLSRIAKINPGLKTITIPKNVQIGNRRWGRIDFLCHYCNYHLVRPDGVILSNSPAAAKEREKRDKQAKREEKANKRKQDKFARR